MRPRDVIDAAHAPAVDLEAGHLAPLDQVDAERVGGAGEGEDDGVVAGDPAAALERRPYHGIADLRRQVDDRADVGDVGRLEPLAVDPPQAVGEDDALHRVRLRLGVGEAQEPARVEEDVVVEFLLPERPALQRELVERHALFAQVVRPHDGRVAYGVAVA